MTINPDEGSRIYSLFVRIEDNKCVLFDNAPIRWRTDSGERPTDEWLRHQEPAYYGYIDNGEPEYNKETEKVEKVPVIMLTPNHDNGTVVQTYNILPLTQEEIDSRIEDLKRQINDERDRRIDLPKSVSLTSGKSFTVDMSNGGRQNIGDLGTAALAKASINDTSTISFRDADNVDWDLTNEDIIEMGLQVTAQVSSIHVKARAIKALNPIPTDYTEDSYWV